MTTTTLESSADIDALIKNIGIPARPEALADLQVEMGKEDPDFRRIAKLVSIDVAMSASVLRIVNSAAYNLSRPCETIDQAISMIGLKQVGVLVTGLMLRNALPTEGPSLTRFWDVSSKRAYAVSTLAKTLGGVDPDVGQMFGLFCDVGIPLLMRRFPTYRDTLKVCNEEAVEPFTTVEQAIHQTDHTVIGGIMARTWGVSPQVCAAIRRHHDYTVFRDREVEEPVSRLVAMGLLTEVAIQRFSGMNHSNEWEKGGDGAAGVLILNDEDVEDWIERLLGDFAAGCA